MIHFTKKLQVLVISLPVIIEPSGSGSFFLENWTLKAVEASEVAEAGKSMSLERFLRPRKSLLWTSESSRFSNSIILGLISLYFDVMKKNFFDRIMKTHIRF